MFWLRFPSTLSFWEACEEQSDLGLLCLHYMGSQPKVHKARFFYLFIYGIFFFRFRVGGGGGGGGGGEKKKKRKKSSENDQLTCHFQ